MSSRLNDPRHTTKRKRPLKRVLAARKRYLGRHNFQETGSVDTEQSKLVNCEPAPSTSGNVETLQTASECNLLIFGETSENVECFPTTLCDGNFTKVGFHGLHVGTPLEYGMTFSNV